MDVSAIQVPVNAPGVVEFNQQRDALWLLVQAVMVGTPVAILWSGLAARWRDMIAKAAGGREIWIWILTVSLFLIAWNVAVSPFAFLMEIVHREAWGRPTDDVEVWVANRGLALGGQILAISILARPLVWLQRRFVQGWWVIVCFAVWLTVSAGLTVEQVWIRPLLSPVNALADGPLKAQFDALAARCTSKPVPVFVGGVGTGGTVVGVGPLTRILMAPADISRAGKSADAQEEVIGTMAHELSHFVFHDTWLALAVVGPLIFGTAVLAITFGRLAVGMSQDRLRVAHLRDPAAAPLLLMAIALIWTGLAAPLLNAVQRHIELRADKFAIEITRNSASRLEYWMRNASENPERIQEYYWFFETFRATHPSTAERVRLAMTYRPWETGAPGVMDEICSKD